MIADFRQALDNLADGLGVKLPDLSDDEYLSVAEIMVREHGTTMSATFLDLNRIVNRVVDRRIRPCCEGEVYAGPSGVRKRHTCRARRGEPYEAEFATAEKAAAVIDLEARRPRKVHPACIAAWNDGATPCWRCLPRLCPGDCDHDACRYAEAHMDDDDDRRKADL